jgi:hypothetical protein
MPGLLGREDALLGFFKTPEVSQDATKIEAGACVRGIQDMSFLVSYDRLLVTLQRCAGNALPGGEKSRIQFACAFEATKSLFVPL